jgi:potassium-transporting ATPase KdpC subunit
MKSLRMLLWLTFVTGIVYPLLITGIAQLTMKQQADGDMIYAKGKIIGATLIAQKFENEKYFQGRPSAVDYNPLPSGGSNLSLTSTVLKKAVDERRAAIEKWAGKGTAIPSELLFASGSGLDPHISPAAAHFQMKKIIKARGWDEKKAVDRLSKLIQQMTEKRLFGFLGEPRVNVLKLNIAVDELDKEMKTK